METFGEFVRLREEGKVVHLRLSNGSAAQLHEAQAEAPVVSVQNRLNPIDRDDVENGMVDACAEAGVAYIPYGTVGGGGGHESMAAKQTLKELAAKYGVSPYAVVLAWLLGLGGHVIPIPGASKPTSIRDSASAAGLTLEPEDARRIAAL